MDAIKNCIKCIDRGVKNKTLPSKWSCVIFAIIWFEKDFDAVPLEVLYHINALNLKDDCDDVIKCGM